jgi:membrane protease YdiL (CAAX protease family)
VRGERERPGPAAFAGIAVLAATLFLLLFRFRRFGPLDFWWWMALNVWVAAALGLTIDRNYASRLPRDLAVGFPRKAAIGLLSAGALYAIFALGRLAALRIFPFAASGIASVYGLRSGAGTARIIVLLGLAIGPGEEILWRGFFQENLGRRLGRGAGFALTAAVYALVHVSSGNVMLVLAAAVCGLFWGLLYLAFKSTAVNIVSHALWAVVTFVARPL